MDGCDTKCIVVVILVVAVNVAAFGSNSQAKNDERADKATRTTENPRKYDTYSLNPRQC